MQWCINIMMLFEIYIQSFCWCLKLNALLQSRVMDGMMVFHCNLLCISIRQSFFFVVVHFHCVCQVLNVCAQCSRFTSEHQSYCLVYLIFTLECHARVCIYQVPKIVRNHTVCPQQPCTLTETAFHERHVCASRRISQDLKLRY